MVFPSLVPYDPLFQPLIGGWFGGFFPRFGRANVGNGRSAAASVESFSWMGCCNPRIQPVSPLGGRPVPQAPDTRSAVLEHH